MEGCLYHFIDQFVNIIWENAQLLTIIGAIIAIAGFAYNLFYRSLDSLVSLLRYAGFSDYPAEGVYIGLRTGHTPDEVFDLLELTRTGLFSRKLSGRLIYRHVPKYNYDLTLKIGDKESIYIGRWTGDREEQLYGVCQFWQSDPAGPFCGVWAGSDPRRSTIRGGLWYLIPTGLKSFSWFSPWKSLPRRLKRCLRTIMNQTPFHQWVNGPSSDPYILDDIIERHESIFSLANGTHVTYEYEHLGTEVQLTIPKGAFHPGEGKISERLLEVAEKYLRTEVENTDESLSVLDLGCGVGFYAIYLAKWGASRVIGVDSDERSVSYARNNRQANGLSAEAIDFRTSDSRKPSDLYSKLDSDERFDLIIANLPFTARELCYRHKGSQYHESFAASERLWFHALLGAQFHLRPGGRMFFAWGASGYTESIRKFERLTKLSVDLVAQDIEGDDDFYIGHVSRESLDVDAPVQAQLEA